MAREIPIREYKTKHQLTNKALAEMMGVSHKAVSQFLNSPYTIIVKEIDGKLYRDHRSGFRYGTYKALSAKRRMEEKKKRITAKARIKKKRAVSA